MLQLRAHATFCDIQGGKKAGFEVSPPNWHSATSVSVWRASRSLSLSLCPIPSLLASPRGSAARQPLQHLRVSPSLYPWGTTDNTWSSEPESQLECFKRAFSYCWHIPGPISTDGVLQVAFGVKYFAWGYSIWSTTNWMVYSTSTPPPTHPYPPSPQISNPFHLTPFVPFSPSIM